MSYNDYLEYIEDIQALADLRLEAFVSGFDKSSLELAKSHYEKIKRKAALTKDIFLPIEHVIKAFDLNELEENFFYVLFVYETNGEYKKKLLNLQTLGSPLPFETMAMLAGNVNVPYLSAYSNLVDILLTFNDMGGFFIKKEIIKFIFNPNKVLERPWVDSFHPYLYSEELLFDMEIDLTLSRLINGYLEDKRNSHFISVYGVEGSGRKALVRYAARKNNLSILFINCKALSYKNEFEFEKAINEIEMESLLKGNILCLCNIESISKEGEKLNALLWGIRRISRLVFLTTEESGIDFYDFGYIITDCAVPRISRENSVKLWETEVKAFQLNSDVDFDKIANVFRLTPLQIKRAAQNAYAEAIKRGLSEIGHSEFTSACRSVSTKNISALGKIIEPAFQWDDLILPPEQKDTLRRAIERIKYQDAVYKNWGFDKKTPYGAGLRILLSGLPGTGKTMTARTLANELGMPVYKVDLSAVISKYIGETEKSLNKVFEEGEATNSILFFDEADALFGKRTEIKDSHDRHANLQVSFLLQKIEEHRGIVMLATNLVKNFDDAFKRRFHFIINIPMPGIEQRRAIWENVFPKCAPLESGVDFEYLSNHFELSGSNIKNIALSAAFYAARGNKSIGMKEIILALKEEVAKDGRFILSDDFIDEYE